MQPPAKKVLHTLLCMCRRPAWMSSALTCSNRCSSACTRLWTCWSGPAHTCHLFLSLEWPCYPSCTLAFPRLPSCSHPTDTPLEAIQHPLSGVDHAQVFNPPYVPTPDEELLQRGIALAWAGGSRGRAVINRFMPLVS